MFYRSPYLVLAPLRSKVLAADFLMTRRGGSSPLGNCGAPEVVACTARSGATPKTENTGCHFGYSSILFRLAFRVWDEPIDTLNNLI